MILAKIGEKFIWALLAPIKSLLVVRLNLPSCGDWKASYHGRNIDSLNERRYNKDAASNMFACNEIKIRKYKLNRW